MGRKVLVTVWAGSLVLLAALGLGAMDRGGWGDGMRPAHHLTMGRGWMDLLDDERAKAALGLNEEQATRLRQILVDTQKSQVKIGADLAVRGIELREMLRSDNPDRAAVMKKVQEISDLRAQMMKTRVEALLAGKTVLTPDQQKKLRMIMDRQVMRRWGSAGEPRIDRGPRPRGPAPLGPRPDEPPVK